MQRRFALRNETNLYRRTCALTGKPMIALYSEDKPYTIYSESAWASDAWEPMDYAVAFDFSKTFFEQFGELMHRVPRRGMHQDGTSENCDFTSFGMNNKNCYLAFSCGVAEDVYYSTWVYFAKNCIDCMFCFKGELLYECVDCHECYHTFYSHDCRNCQDSMLLEDCRNCRHCIGCKNLREKEYHIYNKPVSREEFETKRSELLNGGIDAEKTTFNQWRVTLPTPYAHITRSDNCSGDYIDEAKNCIDCFGVQLNMEDSRHCQMCGWNAKDMMDCSCAGKNANILYEMHSTANGTHSCMCDSFSGNCEHVYYCENIKNAAHCFGCIGLSNKKFHILNKQYAEQEYFDLLPRIIEHMRAGHEWGEFFPVSISPFAYNETFAQEHFPLSKEEVLTKGWKWKDIAGEPPQVPEAMLDTAIICEATGQPFRIIKQELEFYRREGLPLPRLHPDERRRRRLAMRTPYKIWNRECAKCQKPIATSYAPERPEIVYCERCYLETVY